MRRRIPRVIPATLLAAAFATACGDSSTGTRNVVSLEVSAPDLFLEVGDSMLLVVHGKDGSGGAVPVSGVSWSSLDVNIATVDSRGMAYGVSQGVARITASAGAVRDTFRLSVGGVMSFNVNSSDACESPTMREAALRAVSEHAMIFEDTSNPSGGFTADQYQSIAVTFDTLIYPVVTEAFGVPSDVDRNGRVIILYTSAVNKLTAAGSNSFVAGFHFSRDLYPRSPASGMAGCSTSNVAEMFYMLAPDPNGELGNVRTRNFVLERTLATVGHEFQHLINASRRLFESNATSLESVWLNEGMSHIAEELLFYRASGMTALQRIGPDEVRGSGRRLSAFNEYANSNFGRLAAYMADPDTAGPYHANDNLATRGAAWSFLRYAADRSTREDMSIWQALAGSPQTGFTNLDAAMGSGTRRWVADWAVANTTDRYSTSGVADPFLHRSWRHHRLLSELSRSTLRVRTLGASAVIERAVAGGGSVHIAFRIGASGGAVFPRLAGNPVSSCSGRPEHTLAVGEVVQGTLAELAAICLAPVSGSGQNFVLTATHLSSASGATVTFQLSGNGLQNPTFASVAPPSSGPLLQAARAQEAEGDNFATEFELGLREREKRELEWRLGRGGVTEGPSLQTGGVPSDVIVSVVRVP